MYGAIIAGQSKPKKNGMAMGVGDIVACIIVPLLIFIVVFYVRGMFIHYSFNFVHYVICYTMLLFVFVFGVMAVRSFKMSVAVVFVLSLIGWLSAFQFGNMNFKRHTVPYYDNLNLNIYNTVDPAKYTGQQLMDAGQIEFVPGTHIDLKKSYGFKNEDIYCIAPIVGLNSSKDGVDFYDFWAIGLNCCSGHAPDFHCGEYTNPHAHKGLRLMRDDQRNFFRLAVEEAEAAYNIKANFPIFMYWMESPSDEVNSYQDDAIKMFFMGIGAFVALEVCITIWVIICFNR